MEGTWRPARQAGLTGSIDKAGRERGGEEGGGEGAKKGPKGAKREPKGSQRGPKGSQNGAKIAPGTLLGLPWAPVGRRGAFGEVRRSVLGGPGGGFGVPLGPSGGALVKTGGPKKAVLAKKPARAMFVFPFFAGNPVNRRKREKRRFT